VTRKGSTDPGLLEVQKEGSPTQARRGRGHGDREIAGTGAELFVRWAGAGFSWKSGAGGAQWGRLGENSQEKGR